MDFRTLETIIEVDTWRLRLSCGGTQIPELRRVPWEWDVCRGNENRWVEPQEGKGCVRVYCSCGMVDWGYRGNDWRCRSRGDGSSHGGGYRSRGKGCHGKPITVARSVAARAIEVAAAGVRWWKRKKRWGDVTRREQIRGRWRSSGRYGTKEIIVGWRARWRRNKRKNGWEVMI